MWCTVCRIQSTWYIEDSFMGNNTRTVGCACKDTGKFNV